MSYWLGASFGVKRASILAIEERSLMKPASRVSVIRNEELNDVSLDRRDLGIIARVQQDGRASLSEMALALGIQRNTVKGRLSRPIEKRILIGGLLVDPVALGYLVPTTIGLRVSPSQANTVADGLAALSHIQWVSLCRGGRMEEINFLLRMRVLRTLRKWWMADGECSNSPEIAKDQ